MKIINPSVLAVAVLSLLAVVLAALFEIGAAICASATMFAIYGLIWTGVLAPFLLRHPTRIKNYIFTGMIASLALLYIVPWNTRKPFLRDFEKVKVGMTVDQVEDIMSRYMKGTGWILPTSSGKLTDVGSGITLQTSNAPSGELMIHDAITYRHSNEGAFNSDWGVVKFKDGRVEGKIFMPD